MSTQDLFREDAQLRDCAATLLRVDERGLLLDRTVFYPQGGGQAGDDRVADLARPGGAADVTRADARERDLLDGAHQTGCCLGLADVLEHEDGAPDGGDVVLQAVAGQEVLDAGHIVVADHGAAHAGGLQLLKPAPQALGGAAGASLLASGGAAGIGRIGLSEHLLAQGQRFRPAQPHLHQGGGGGDQVVVAAGHGGDAGRADRRVLAQAIGAPQQRIELRPQGGLHPFQTQKNPGLGQGDQFGLADAEGAVLVEQHRFHVAEARAAEQQLGHGVISRG